MRGHTIQTPADQGPRKGCADQLAEELQAGRLTADELLRRYCSIVYAQTRNYEEAARRLGLDRRTVKAKVEGKDETENGKVRAG